ncbi:hypothetical protein DUY81_11500 [Acidipropionibacterium acidipropionici]|uniref:Uncharacterized protein n=1 Tax=Acidipropionibacterium acidipropionici TaxID=1748 RepID=A0AAC9FCJ5_9ACTN|nr:hypothetical protein [Acidipropionibacterium acidipropionici]AMS04156.1 hypothetical protein AXH35_00305 [Acidipropionibacterium acidipropionici]AMS06868.1 hypothetical protein AXH35_16840 [Acidipropionibacterium acidipropionici]AZP38336.1 hypothetical protein DUY81_11500 [Acidipropionibacterium acidipropionici]
MTSISPAAQKKLRGAMERLLAGTPQRTDGRLTKTNLAAEAGLSRATMNRATEILKEWNQQVTGRAPRVAGLHEAQEDNHQLRQTIVALRARNADLEKQAQAAATVIAELDAQLQAAREHHTGPTPLRGSSSTRH